MRRLLETLAVVTVVASWTSATPAVAQSLAERVVSSGGTVQVIYPSRPSACGDGDSFIANVFGRSTSYIGNSLSTSDGRFDRACVHGPARAVATVIGGEVTRIRAYVGPVPAARDDIKTLNASADEAAAWLGDLVQHGTTRTADDAMLPLILAAAPDPWPLLLRVARDSDRAKSVRGSALMWLSTGVTDHLGLNDARDASDEDEMRTQAVFVLSQRPKSESVPELVDVALRGTHASARRAAIFWLGQTGDPRATDVYAQLLGLR